MGLSLVKVPRWSLVLALCFSEVGNACAKGCCPDALKVSVAQLDFGGTLKAMLGALSFVKVQRQEEGVGQLQWLLINWQMRLFRLMHSFR